MRAGPTGTILKLAERTLAAANNRESEGAAPLRDQIRELKRVIDGSGLVGEIKSRKAVSYRKPGRTWTRK
jgi:excinuclease UvrABC nuclease subunit